MRSERLARAVRAQLRPGRLLPLGGGADRGLWLTERAATAVLRSAAAALPGVRLDEVRVAPDDPAAGWPERDVVRPPGALPPGALRVVADCAAATDEPLPDQAARLRAVLAAAALERLGLDLARVEVTVTGLLEDDEPLGRDAPTRAPDGDGLTANGATDDRLGPGSGVAGAVLWAVLGVPGVTRPAPVLGGSGHAVRTEHPPEARDSPGFLVQLAVNGAQPVVDTARAARVAAADAAGTDQVALLVTAVEEAPWPGAEPAEAPDG